MTLAGDGVRSKEPPASQETVVLPPRAEHHVVALGIGESAPRLSWRVETSEHGWAQRAYEVEGLDEEGQRLWSTGRVESGESVLVPWPGRPLGSRERVSVRVRVWGDGADTPSPWSSTTPVEAGLLEQQDWEGAFITPAVGTAELPAGDRAPILLRREFQVGEGLRLARVYATACGLYELELNGQSVGDHVLAPGWTS